MYTDSASRPAFFGTNGEPAERSAGFAFVSQGAWHAPELGYSRPATTTLVGSSANTPTVPLLPSAVIP
jgi:hypothetical protein